MGFNDYLQLAIELAALLTFGLGAANRWAVANHRDALASFTSAAANAAGRIRLMLAELPPGADLAATRQMLVSQEAQGLVQEFASRTGPLITATADKAAAMILAKLAPPPPAAPAPP